MEKEFLLRDIAKLEYGNKFDKNKMTHNEPCYNFVGRTEKNNGITDFVDDNGTEPFAAGTITLAFGGSIGSTFIQPKPYYTSQNVGVITLPGEVSENAKIYFIKALEKVCKNRYVAFADEINKHFKTDLVISLPVVPSADPSHVYTPSDIDWGYMERYIAELEEERVAELEAYLQATGLDDCDLTAKDEATLAKEPTFAEFKASALFEIKKGRRLTKADMIPGKIPFVGSSSDNNGITARIGNAEHLHPANTFTVSYNGSVGEVFLQDEKFWASDDVNVWYPRFTFNRESVQYIMAVVKKLGARYSYNAKWGIEAMKGEVLSLPVIPSADPIHAYTPADIDWGYMERYIKAIEKLVTADVVAYKDKVIEGTRQAITVDKEVQA